MSILGNADGAAAMTFGIIRAGLCSAADIRVNGYPPLLEQRLGDVATVFVALAPLLQFL